MPFWKRSKDDAPSRPIPSQGSVAAPPTGTDACSEKECHNHNAVQCMYRDRRGTRCPTSWCPSHYVLVDDAVYCRRHAGMITAIEPTGTGMPDISNRAPSLVHWIAEELDGEIRALLGGILGDVAGATLSVDPMRVSFGMTNRERRWERTWKIVDHTGVTLKVSIEVDEPRDPEVVARVGGHVVMRGIPPWINHRLRKETVTPEVDAQERHEYYRALFNAISEGVASEKTNNYAERE